MIACVLYETSLNVIYTSLSPQMDYKQIYNIENEQTIRIRE